MNNYITLDGKKYAATQKEYTPSDNNLASVRYTLLGASDVTFSNVSPKEWLMQLKSRNVADVGYGTFADLKTSLAKKTSLSFTDFDGTTYTVVAIGPFKHRCNIPNWDSPSASLYTMLMLTKVL